MKIIDLEDFALGLIFISCLMGIHSLFLNQKVCTTYSTIDQNLVVDFLITLGFGFIIGTIYYSFKKTKSQSNKLTKKEYNEKGQ